MRRQIITALGVVGVLVLSGLALFATLRDTPTVSAKEAVEAACNKLANVNHYDMAATVKHTTNGVQEAESFTMAARVSGADWIAKWTSSSDGATGQLARVDGKSYTRDSIDGRGWAYFPTALPHLNASISHLGANLACPSLDKVTLESSETGSDGSALTRYSSGTGAEGLSDAFANPDGSKATIAHTFWVDAEGLLVKHREELHLLLVDPDGRRRQGVQTSVTTYSGIGEPNTITAPVIGE